jgi:arylsulfatase A-like enzyme
MPHETGVNYNDGSSIEKNLPTFGETLSSAGYETVWAGKWHLPEPYPTRERSLPLAIRGFEFLKFYDTEASQKDWGFGSNTDKPLADAVVDYIEDYESSKPFLLCVSFHNPHDICHVPRIPDKYPNPDPSVELPLLPVNHSIQADEPEIITNSRKREYYGNELLLSQGNDEITWRSYLWYYYRLNEEVDVEIGRILQAIRDKGIEDNTLIIFTSDHGDGMAEKKWAAKLSLYEGPSKVPCILYYKGKISANQPNKDHLVSGIDIFPTILDYAGIDIPDNLNGVSLKSIIEHPEKNTREFIVTELGVDIKDHSLTGRMIRSQQYKYNIYSKGDRNEELFDLSLDPLENINLAYDKDMQMIKNKLKAELKEWMVQTEDPFTAINFSN